MIMAEDLVDELQGDLVKQLVNTEDFDNVFSKKPEVCPHCSSDKIFGIENLGKEIVIICDDGENKIRVIAETFSSQINDLIRLKIDRENILLF